MYYFGQNRNQTAWASTIRFILVTRPVRREPEKDEISDWTESPE